MKTTRNLFFAFFLLYACHPSPKEKVILQSLPATQTHIDFTNTLPDRPGLGILSYIYYYNGAGVSIGDINNDGLPDIYFAANSKGHNRLYLNKGNLTFEDITTTAGVSGSSDWCTGVTMADVNGDGRLDIYVCSIANMQGFRGHNELYINNGNNTFTESAKAYGLDYSGFATQSVFFDYDHDGDLDCFILSQSQHPNQNISDTSKRREYDPNAGNRLYRNDTPPTTPNTPHFTDVSATTGLYRSALCYGLGIAVGDLDNDGWEDIYIGNDFHENDFYYHNNRNGTFTESGVQHFRHYSRYSMGNDIADFDNDGQLDLITVDMLPEDESTLKTYGNGEHLDIYEQKITHNGYQNQYSRNCLQHNNGNGASFSDLGLIAGVSATDWSWSPLFADLDNDGNKDLFISNGIVKRPLDLDFVLFFSNLKNPAQYGSPEELQRAMLDKMPDGACHPYLFKGDGQLTFKDLSNEWGTSSLKGYFNGAAYADLDNDGDLDLVINSINSPALLLQNNTPKQHYLTLSLKSPSLNTSGIGAKAYVFTNDKTQYQQLMLTRGFESSSEPRLHFGLGANPYADSILIIWPDLSTQTLRHITADTNLTIAQNTATKQPTPPSLSQPPATITLNWQHHENTYNDFKEQYLIPHMQSTRGPKLAIADVNNDGLDDLFACGAHGQPSNLYIQIQKNRFTPIDTPLFNKNKPSEAVDALFFDANGDGHPDLYVVSGGNQLPDGDSALNDHFYLNDGHGHFTEPKNAIPSIPLNKSCIATADINKDGHPDLFIGGSTSAKRYGLTNQPSYLLINDGHGHFQKTTLFSEPGILTSAAFDDFNKDGWPDLIVAGEWMSPKIFYNHNGSLTTSTLSLPSGLWQTIITTDINDDGYPDILAGNWGLNTKLSAGKDGPLHLYIKDLDNNGTIEQLMTYSIHNEEYPFLGKDQLELALPALKRSHLRYDEVAGKTIQYLFGNQLDSCKRLQAETLSSACFINNKKGGFIKIDLPAQLQLAPISSFLPTTNHQYLALGNFYGVQPYEGRYDAMNPTFFNYDTAFHIQTILPQPAGEWRDAKPITVNGKPLLILARNNDSLIWLPNPNTPTPPRNASTPPQYR
ncbi:MAG: VCBS repeat-containing protein [Bacteroidetes bacterium]|nr:VCBS repeat-containing protein [Bacteroidota bacterium]